MAMEVNQNRRFGGVARLYGEEGLEAFEKAHVLVAGLGGVGSWAAEALARSAIAEITLVDFDHIAESNVNRQLHAVEGSFGKSKVDAMAERLISINPDLRINIIDDFLTPDNLSKILGEHAANPLFAILDATDDVKMKIALANYCKKNIALIICGGAGGKLDPSRIKACDLSKTTQDPLLSKIRYTLRKEYGFTSDPKKKLGLTAIFSDEARQGVASGGLACSGYGSGVTVTASFGFIAAAEVLKIIQQRYLKYLKQLNTEK
jgi:tRNA A37 threonylcarbamoyladenosine dehydratase